MATVLLSPVAKQAFQTASGAPAAGYALYTFAANTSNLQATFTNRAGTVANSNPIILDARGEATIYLTPGVMYDYVLKTAPDPVGSTVWTREDVSADAGDADAVAYNDPLAPAFLKTTSDIINGEPVSVLRNIDKTKWSAIRAGSNSDNLYNNFADLLAAMGTQGYGRLDVPRGKYNISTTLPVPLGVGIHGEGHNATFVQFNAVANGFRLNDHAEVHDICIDGLNVAQAGIHVDAASFTRVSNVRIQNMVFHGYAVTNATQTQARNLSIVNCKERGIIIDPNSSFNLVADAYCSGNAKAALLIGHNSHHNIVRGLMAENTGNAAVWIHNASYKNEVSQVTIKGTTAPAGTPGILIGYNSQDNILSDFLIEGYDVGLMLRGAPADSGFATGDTARNIITAGRIVGTGSGVANSVAILFNTTDSGVTKAVDTQISNVIASNFQYGIREDVPNSALNNSVLGGSFQADITTPYSMGSSSATRASNVRGITGVGSLGGATPAFPATNVPVTNTFPYPVMVFIKGMPNTGTREVWINGATTGLSPTHNDGNGSYILQPQQTITVFYGTGTPSWTWFGM